jgi:hypothetical protein
LASADTSFMSERLQRLLGANRQRRRAEAGLPLRDNFVARFERATGCYVDPNAFLPVEQADELAVLVLEQSKTLIKDAEWHNATSLFYAGVAALAPIIGEARYYLHCATSDLMGMPHVPLAPLLESLDEFWMPEAEDLIVTSKTADDGLLLEWCDDWIELRTWGWLSEVLNRGD